MSELKPCPFCGMEPFYGQHRLNGIVVYDIGCPSIDCLAQPECSERDYESAKAAWNTRATPPRAEVDVEAVVRAACAVLPNRDYSLVTEKVADAIRRALSPSAGSTNTDAQERK